jgi:cell shape-determining protein MreC
VSDQAIIALVCAVAGGIGSLVYFLMANIKSQLEVATRTMIEKMDKFVHELAELKEIVSVKATMLDYLQREVESLKKQCWQCQQKRD